MYIKKQLYRIESSYFYHSTHLAIPCSTACLCICSRALSSSSSFRNWSIFFDSASAFCSAFHTFSTFRSVCGCQLFFKFCLKLAKRSTSDPILLQFRQNANTLHIFVVFWVKTYQIASPHLVFVSSASMRPPYYVDNVKRKNHVRHAQKEPEVSFPGLVGSRLISSERINKTRSSNHSRQYAVCYRQETENIRQTSGLCLTSLLPWREILSQWTTLIDRSSTLLKVRNHSRKNCGKTTWRMYALKHSPWNVARYFQREVYLSQL